MSRELFEVISILINFFETALATILVTGFLGVNQNKNWKKYGIITWIVSGCAVCATNYVVEFFEGILVFVPVIIYFIYSLAALGGNIYKKIIASVLPLFCIGIINSAVAGIYMSLTHKTLYSLMESRSATYLLLILITKILFVLLGWIILKVSNNFKKISENKMWFVFMTAIVISIVSEIFLFLTLVESNLDIGDSINIVVVMVALIILNIMVFYFIKRISLENEMKNRITMLEQNVVFQKKNMEFIVDEQEKIRKIRHDIKNQMLAISGIARRGDCSRIEEYCEKYLDEIGAVDLKEYTGIASVDNLISYKLNFASENNIQVSVVVDGIGECIGNFTTILQDKESVSSQNANMGCPKLDEMEFCLIVGNLLDNAIEYLLQLPKNHPRILNIRFENIDDVLHIRISNSIEKSVLHENPELQTSKTDKKGHGYGIQNVKEIVKLRGGLVSFNEHNGKFIVYIEIP